MEERKIVADWMENELRRQLRPVPAPDSLSYDALFSRAAGRRPYRSSSRPAIHSFSGWRVPVFATLLILISAGLFLQIRGSRASARDIAQITEQELQVFANSASGDTFLSDDPAQIRNWIKDKGNIDVQLPNSRSTAVRLLGAKLVSLRGSLIAAVAYRIGKDSATLLVSRRTECCAASPASRHLVSKVNTPGGKSLFSWDMKDQTYTIAYAGTSDPQGGCLLCHAEAHNRL
jgi:hypothetical protein